MFDSWENLFPNLIAAYDQGKLVPFLGAGASPGGCTLWPEFVASLERSVGIEAQDMRELLLAGLFRIGLEVWRSETEVLRLSELISENTDIDEIRARYYIPEEGWSFMVEPSPTGSKEYQAGIDVNHGERSGEMAGALGLFPRRYPPFFSGTPSIDDGTLTDEKV